MWTDPAGATKVTLTKHWMQRKQLVKHTISEDGEYKVYYQLMPT